MAAAPLDESSVRTGIWEELPVTKEATTSRVVINNALLRVVVFAMDAGQELTEHTAAVPVLLQVLDGRLRVGADGKQVELAAGGLVHIGSRVPHELLALEPTRMALIMLDPRVE